MIKKLSERMKGWIKSEPTHPTRGWCDLVVELAETMEAIIDGLALRNRIYDELFSPTVHTELVGAVEPGDTDGTIRQSRYPIMEALAKAVRVETSDMRDTTIRKLHQRAEVAESWLAEAKAEIERLREECNELREAKARIANGAWEHRQEIGRLCAKCDEAKAEIERLREERDSAEHKLEALGAIDERILADAAIGRLVWGMRNETCFWRRGDGRYAGRTLRFGVLARPLEMSDFLTGRECRDPAEALRSIQASE